MHYHLLEHQGGVETQTRKARVMTTHEGSSRYKYIRKPSLHNLRSFSCLKTCNNIVEIEHFFQIKDLRHPNDTSIRVTADDVNFVTNAEYAGFQVPINRKVGKK